MSAWVYKCAECDLTFVAEAEDGAEPAENTKCPQCGDLGAAKQFELSKPSGGCSCGSGGCC